MISFDANDIPLCQQRETLYMATTIILALFSAKTVQLDDDSLSRIIDGDYPTRVKSKVLATVREQLSTSNKENIVGFLPLNAEDIQDHYGDLALYLTPEIPCKVVSDLIGQDTSGKLVCKKELVKDCSVIIIADRCGEWTAVEKCMKEAGAASVTCISIFD